MAKSGTKAAFEKKEMKDPQKKVETPEKEREVKKPFDRIQPHKKTPAKINETFEEGLSDEERELETEFLEENPELNEEDIKTVKEALPELMSPNHPEISNYLKGVAPKLSKTIERINLLRSQKKLGDAVTVLTGFFEEEEKNIDAIKDPKSHDTLQSFLSSALNVHQMQKDMEHAQKVELLSAGADVIPGVGPLKMLTEAGLGKKATGETIEGKQRLTHAAEGVGFLALDAVLLAGMLTAPATAGGGAVVGLGAEGIKATRLAEVGAKGLEAGRVITRFAALCRKTERLSGASKAIFKFGRFLERNPEISKNVIRLIENRRQKQSTIFQEKLDKAKATKLG